MRILVAYSGGKDSQASLIWAVKESGFKKKNIVAVFCDTGWENPITYRHIHSTCNDLGVKLVIVKSKKYEGMVDMAKKKGRFASTMARFCTSELKSIPFIDYVLEQKEHLIIIQGIRANESAKRSTMNRQCTYFKYYFEPYNDNGKTHTYRKKDIIEFKSKYSDDILRPVFEWSGQEVIDYIIANGQSPNKLYSQGFKRVGCFPCFMSGHQEIRQLIKRYPDRFKEIIAAEESVNSSFFKIDSIPERDRTGVDEKTGKKLTKAGDFEKYLKNKNSTIDMFEEGISCSSYYHLCE